jgi:hypothetical protein
MTDKAPERWCMICMLNSNRDQSPPDGRGLLARKHVPAKFVASGPECIPGHPIQWFDCGKHDEDAHPFCGNDPRFQRMILEPIERWFFRTGFLWQ